MHSASLPHCSLLRGGAVDNVIGAEKRRFQNSTKMTPQVSSRSV